MIVNREDNVEGEPEHPPYTPAAQILRSPPQCTVTTKGAAGYGVSGWTIKFCGLAIL